MTRPYPLGEDDVNDHIARLKRESANRMLNQDYRQDVVDIARRQTQQELTDWAYYRKPILRTAGGKIDWVMIGLVAGTIFLSASVWCGAPIVVKAIVGAVWR